jgi:hypothetical protein
MLALPHVIVDGSFSYMTIIFVKHSVASEAPLQKGYLVALACNSVTRSTTASPTEHFEQIAVCLRHLP